MRAGPTAARDSHRVGKPPRRCGDPLLPLAIREQPFYSSASCEVFRIRRRAVSSSGSLLQRTKSDREHITERGQSLALVKPANHLQICADVMCHCDATRPLCHGRPQRPVRTQQPAPWRLWRDARRNCQTSSAPQLCGALSHLFQPREELVRCAQWLLLATGRSI